MVQGWIELITKPFVKNTKKEFVSVDARTEIIKKDTRSYEMLSRDSSAAVTPVSPVKSADGRRTPDYFGRTAQYHAPTRSFSSPRPPPTSSWDAKDTYASPTSPSSPRKDMINPLGMNRASGTTSPRKE